MNHTIVTELSANIRGLARVALAGKWPTAVLTMLTATLLVAVPAGIIERMMEGQSASESFLLNLVTILIGGPVALGTCFFLIRLFRNQEISVAILFTGFDYFVKAALLRLVTSILILLWTLLFIVPGIIADIRYSQAFYILADHPDKDIMECIEDSKYLMQGNKWKFFCLNISFIGWAILASIPAGLGWLLLLPYIGTAQTAFYEMVTGSLRPRVQEGDYNYES